MQIEQRIAQDFDQANDELRLADLAFEKKRAAGFSISFLTSLLGQFGAVALTAYLIYRGKLEAGSFISVTGITMARGAPLFWIANYWQTLIENLTITLTPGSHTLITGPSGCGKSTLANLLLRYDDTLSGDILIDGQRLQEMGDISSFASISRQEAILFSDSFRENLSMGNPEICDEDIIDLLKKVGLEKWANKPSLDKRVEAQGENLSGGEKKRLSLVRALLRKMPLVILDEPLANIDPDNVERIESLLGSLDNCTLIVISHQGSEIFRASFDQIIEFKDRPRSWF